MKVMKARNAKACWGFVWIKPVSDWDRAQGYLVFPVGVRKATNRVCKLWRAHGELGHPHQLHVRVQPGVVQELMPLTRLCLGGEELGGGVPGRWIWKPESHPVAILWFLGKAISQRVSPPGKAKGGSHVRHWAWLKQRQGWTSVLK